MSFLMMILDHDHDLQEGGVRAVPPQHRIIARDSPYEGEIIGHYRL